MSGSPQPGCPSHPLVRTSGVVLDDSLIELVAQSLLAAAVELDVVRAPALGEELGARGQLTHQLGEGLVIGFLPASRRSMAAASLAIRS
jgi:hypothetical protein